MFLRASALCFVLSASLAVPAAAQLNTQHVKGTYGLKAGTQAGPGGYVVAPLLYIYNSDTVRDRDGDRLGPRPDLTASLFGTGYMHVLPKKVLGGLYGFNVLLAGANNRIQGTEIDANPGAGLTDAVVEPVMLGWHFKRADVNTGYTIYVPIGRYTDGADNNTGLGMWGHEVMAGVTGYLTEDRKYHVATAMSLNLQSKKEDSETKVGNAMNFEGGVGADFLGGGLSVGLVYYSSFKLQEDRIDGVPGILIRGKNKAFAVGPEVTLALARKNVVFGSLTARYFFETYARTTTQGNGFILQVSFLTKPIHLPTK
jgi:hypothetical protein